MKKAVDKAVKKTNVLIMAAAVADYTPKTNKAQKFKKENGEITLELKRTADILGGVKGSFVKVGFAAESENLIENAKRKLKNKALDMIVTNDITAKDSGFGAVANRVTIIDSKGKLEKLPLLSKQKVAGIILDRIEKLL